MKVFASNWTDEIASVTGSREFQRADVIITLPDSDDAEWDWEGQGGWVPGNPAEILYEGQARIIGVRWGTQSGGESQANAKTISAIRFQVPKAAAGRVNRGAIVNVRSSWDNPVLTEFQFKITSDMQGSSAATRTFEAGLDSDVKVSP